jgi:hypothetical protein
MEASAVMKVAMMQPTFLPWQGFFELIYQSERFIFLDDFQFSIQSYHQRNRLFVNKNQVDWYTVPIRKSVSFQMPLNQTLINESTPWRTKMWKRIQQNYSRARCYSQVAPHVEQWLFEQTESLTALNIAFIMRVCNILGFQRDFLQSSMCQSAAQRSERVAELLNWSGTDIYYCAKGAFDYMLHDGVFPLRHIDVLFQDFRPDIYPQIGSQDNFYPYLSVLDALMNVGPDATESLITNGTDRWLTWDEMASSWCGKESNAPEEQIHE